MKNSPVAPRAVRDPPFVRGADVTDADAVSGLCRTLGYNVSPHDAHHRIARIDDSENHLLLVLEDTPGRLDGFILMEEVFALTRPAHARIAALVVTEYKRGTGLGRALVNAGEAWARDRGLFLVRLTSRENRHGAHAFYERMGYRTEKTSKMFEKSL